MSKQVLILMGSDSDLGFMSAALKCLKEFEVGYEVAVCSVHRSPEKALGLAMQYPAEQWVEIAARMGFDFVSFEKRWTAWARAKRSQKPPGSVPPQRHAFAMP